MDLSDGNLRGRISELKQVAIRLERMWSARRDVGPGSRRS